MNHQNIESLAPCDGKKTTTDGFPKKKSQLWRMIYIVNLSAH